MANRPVFISNTNKTGYIEIENIEFTWFPGLSTKQKQRSIASLHSNFLVKYPNKKILEISSKSQEELGIKLSAFNLSFIYKGIKLTVESAFQASKVFEHGGPFIDLLKKPSKEVKKDIRLKQSGKLKNFNFFNDIWELEPKTAFYDWLYINAILQNQSLMEKLIEYDAFTDIEFNPQKSINCQARSAALFVSLFKMNFIKGSFLNKEEFLKIVY